MIKFKLKTNLYETKHKIHKKSNGFIQIFTVTLDSSYNYQCYNYKTFQHRIQDKIFTLNTKITKIFQAGQLWVPVNPHLGSVPGSLCHTTYLSNPLWKFLAQCLVPIYLFFYKSQKKRKQTKKMCKITGCYDTFFYDEIESMPQTQIC